MIVSRLGEAENVLSSYYQLLQDRQQSTQLRATLDALQGANRASQSFVQRYKRLAPRLRNHLPTDFYGRIIAVRQKVVDSQAKFAASSWQANALKVIQDDVKKLNDVVEVAWATYAKLTIQPKQELYGLLKELPEIRRSAFIIERMLRDLDDQTRNLPSSDVELQRFDHQLNEVTAVLINVEGLTPAVRDFLVRVHQGTFTLADLSDDVLAWCRDGDRGAAFKIRV